jgi:hypothetical protein
VLEGLPIMCTSACMQHCAFEAAFHLCAALHSGHDQLLCCVLPNPQVHSAERVCQARLFAHFAVNPLVSCTLLHLAEQAAASAAEAGTGGMATPHVAPTLLTESEASTAAENRAAMLAALQVGGCSL